MPERARQWRYYEYGQGMLEYGLIILFVVLVAFGGLILVGPVIANAVGNISNTL